LEQTPVLVSDTVAVILVFQSTPELSDTINSVCCQAGVFARAAVGPFSMGLALLSMLHNEGLLAGCILKSACKPPGGQEAIVKRQSKDNKRPSHPYSVMDDATESIEITATNTEPALPAGRTQEQAKARSPMQRRRGFSGRYKERTRPVQSDTGAATPKAEEAPVLDVASVAGTKQAEVAHHDITAEATLHDPRKSAGTAADSGFFYVGTIKIQVQRNLFGCSSSDIFLHT